MRKFGVKFVVGLAVSCLVAAVVLAEEPTRRVWDQEKAVANVERVLAMEAEGQPWDKIAWETDAAKAVARAEAENKPIFVYLFLKKKVGPAAAPC